MPSATEATETIQCQHSDCDDPPDTTVELADGRIADLCDDHAHMTADGTPVDGYSPTDPAKFAE